MLSSQINIVKAKSSDTYPNFANEELEEAMLVLVILPVWEYGHMVPDCNVALSCKFCSNLH